MTRPTWAGRLMGLLAVGLGGAFVSWWVLDSYFRVSVPASLIWTGDDGYCDPAVSGVGRHCFGDYAQFTNVGLTMNPEGSNPFIRNYPPLNRLFLYLFQIADHLIGPRPAIALYLTLSAVGLLIPVLWASRRLNWTRKAVVVLLAGVATFPFLAALDRGNNIALAVPFLLLYVVSLGRGNFPLMSAAVVVLVQIKPQFGLLVFGFLVLREYRRFIWTGVVAIGVFLASFAVFWLPGAGVDPIWEFKYYILFTRYYDEYLPLDSNYPPNMSWAHDFSWLIHFWNSSLAADTRAVSLVAYLLAAIIIVIISWRGRSVHVVLWSGALVSVSAFVPAISFAYYSAIALPFAAVILRSPVGEDARTTEREGWLDERALGGFSTFWRWLAIGAVVFSLTPMLVPVGEVAASATSAGSKTVVSLLPYLASTMWLATAVTAVVGALFGKSKERLDGTVS